MISVAPASDGGSSNCEQCKHFIAEHPKADSSFACPQCGRSIADVTKALLTSVDQAVLDYLPESVSQEHGIIAFGEIGTAWIMVADVTQSRLDDTLEMLQFILSRQIKCVHGDANAIRSVIDNRNDDDPGESTYSEWTVE